MPGVVAGAVAVGLMGSGTLYPSAQQIAQELTAPTKKWHWFMLGDSRWMGMHTFVMSNMSALAWNGIMMLNNAFSAPASHTTEITAQTAGSAPTNSLTAEAPQWFRGGDSVVEFSGTAMTPGALNDRLTVPLNFSFSSADLPNLWSAVVGLETKMRGWLYALDDKVTASPDLGLWWRDSASNSFDATSPRSDWYDYSSLGAGEYAEVSLTRNAGWSATGNIVYQHWVGESSAPTTNGELAAFSNIIIEGTAPGLTYIQMAIGGAHLDTHFLDAAAFPPTVLSVFAPLIGTNRIFHIDLGTNGGDADGDFLTHMKQLIALCRVGDAAYSPIVITTAYDASTDAGEKAYVKLLYQLMREVPGVIVLDTRAALYAYVEGVAAGYYGDTVHYNNTGRAALATTFDALIAEIDSNGAYHMGYLGTNLTTDPMQVGEQFEEGMWGVGTPGSAVQVKVNDEEWGSTTCDSNGDWGPIINTPTVAMRGAGADVDVVVTFGTTRTTTRPTTIAAA